MNNSTVRELKEQPIPQLPTVHLIPCCECLSVTGFLLGINVPHHVIRQSVHAIAGSLGHLRESFRFGLVLEGVAGEVDTFDG